MLESPAYRVLSLSAHRILARLEIELAHHGGSDNGKLPTTYEQFQDFGIDRQAIAPAIRELEALGFIEITVRGRAGNAEHREPNRFRLTYRHTEKANSTDEWRRVQTLEKAQMIARTARRASRGKSAARGNQKRIASVGSPQISVGNIHTEPAPLPVGELHTTGHGGETHTTLDISGRGTVPRCARVLRTARAAR
jgi:hypothetical protein